MSDRACGNRFYRTLCLARSITSDKNEHFFEIIRYFDKLTISNHKRNESVLRIWQILQRKECNFRANNSYRCSCKVYEPANGAISCVVCHHEHTQVCKFSDLDKLPCIVILVEKGRLSDTFPPCMNVMDLRVRHQKTMPKLTSLVQEIGRLWRHQLKSNMQELPYVLVGPAVMLSLRNSVSKSAVFIGAHKNGQLDSYTRQNKPKEKSTKKIVHFLVLVNNIQLTFKRICHVGQKKVADVAIQRRKASTLKIKSLSTTDCSSRRNQKSEKLECT